MPTIGDKLVLASGEALDARAVSVDQRPRHGGTLRSDDFHESSPPCRYPRPLPASIAH